jgi:hypothetical protein
MVPLHKRNPLLKLPNSGLLSERRFGFLPHQNLICLGVGITLITGGFLASEAWLFLSFAAYVHELADVQSPRITALLESQRALAELVSVEAGRRLSATDPGAPPGPTAATGRLDQYKLSLAEALILSAKGDVSSDDQKALMLDIKNVFDMQSELGVIEPGSTANTGRFTEIIEGRVTPFFDSTSQLMQTHKEQFVGLENYPMIGFSDTVFVLTIWGSGTVLMAASIYLVLRTKRLVNPALLGALVLVLDGGFYIQNHLATSMSQLKTMEEALLSIQQIEGARANDAQLNMTLHIWALTMQKSYWDKARDLNSGLTNFKDFGSSFAPLMGPREDWKPSDNVTGAQIEILNQWNQQFSNDVSVDIARDVSFLQGPNADIQFDSLDQAWTADQTKATKQLKDAELAQDSALQNMLWVGMATCVVTIGLTWAGLIARIKEYYGR